MKKLTLDPLQVEIAHRIVGYSCKHYETAQESETTLVDLSVNQLRYESLTSISRVVKKLYDATENSKPHMHRHYLELTPTQALVFVTSIVPTCNLTYLEKVKQAIVDYCYDVLKEAGIIPNNPTYIPPGNNAPSEPEAFINKSTTINDYLND